MPVALSSSWEIDLSGRSKRVGVPVGHAYGYKIQTPFRFTDADIAKLQSLMSAAKTKTAADERTAIRETLAWMEHRVDGRSWHGEPIGPATTSAAAATPRR